MVIFLFIENTNQYLTLYCITLSYSCPIRTLTIYYMAMTQPWMRGVLGITAPVQLWWGIQPISAGVFGVPLGFAVMVVVSLLSRPPSESEQAVAERVRYPT